jgi:primosomal protein N' (replication factor Y)
VVRIANEPATPKTPLEATVLEHVRAAGTIAVRTLTRAAGADAARAVRALVARGVLATDEERKGPRVTTRFAALFTIARALDESEKAALGKRAPRQLDCYERIAAAPTGRIDAAELDPAGRAAAAALVKRGIVERARAERYRDTGDVAAAGVPPALTAAQRSAVDAIAPDAFQVFLLHGVTGSGKTEVYLQLAARACAAGRSVLMLVPEIALTLQLVRRAQERFGDAVAIVHSGLGPGQRWDEWRRIARGEARVVVGTRSAVFAPLVDLGLVIVDEEHDAAYKQDEGFGITDATSRSCARSSRRYRSVLGSATPSIESYQQALDGKYRLLTLGERVHGQPLPQVTLVDLRSPGREARGTAARPRCAARHRQRTGRAGRAALLAPLLDAMQENWHAASRRSSS